MGKVVAAEKDEILREWGKVQRRMRDRIRYRRRRDRKLRDDWLGRTFGLKIRDELTGTIYVAALQVVGYNQERATVRMQTVGEPHSVVWDTDRFWSLLRTGVMEEA